MPERGPLRRATETLDIKAHYRLAEPPLQARQRLGTADSQRARLPAMGVGPAHGAKAVPSKDMVPDEHLALPCATNLSGEGGSLLHLTSKSMLCVRLGEYSPLLLQMPQPRRSILAVSYSTSGEITWERSGSLDECFVAVRR